MRPSAIESILFIKKDKLFFGLPPQPCLCIGLAHPFGWGLASDSLESRLLHLTLLLLHRLAVLGKLLKGLGVAPEGIGRG